MKLREASLLSEARSSQGDVMRIAFLVRTLSDRATSRLTLALATEMGERGHDVTVVSFHRAAGAPNAVANAQLVNLDTGKSISAAGMRRLRRWVGQWHPNVMFCQGPGPGRAAVVARSWSREDLRVVAVDHNPPWTRFSPLNVILRKTDVLAAPTRSAAIRLSKRMGVRDVTVLPDPLLVKIEKGAAPSHRWYSDGHPVVCSVANIIPRKGQDIVIRALSTVDARLVLVGRFDDADYLRRLQELALELGVLDRVWFAGYQGDPLPYIWHADAFALGSRSESFGMVLAEAMACGTPVVATDCPDGPRNVLDEGRAGLLVPMDDPFAMARGLQRVLEDENTRNRLIQAGRRKAESLSVERVADTYLKAVPSRPRRHQVGSVISGFGCALSIASLCDGGGAASMKVPAIAHAVSSML
jgi:glycosyltransferase involved in cell wall biosynthesis